jgi:RNA polymerase sigma factor (TIGR02999 family)
MSEKPSSQRTDVTRLLRAWSQGDEHALEQLVPLVHAELHRLAHRYMSRERGDHTLQTTALINEAFLRLVHSADVQWENRAHFFAVSASIMRHILVDFARARLHQKRGGQVVKISLDQAPNVTNLPSPDLVALNDALSALAQLDSRKAKVVELRFFGGLTVDETAEVLQTSTATVIRDWQFAKVWLLRELNQKV